MKNRFNGIRIEKRPWISEFRDLSESWIALDLLLSNHNKNINWIDLNRLDLFNLKWLNDNDLEKVINDLLKNKEKNVILKNWEVLKWNITIDMPEWLEIINSLFNDALIFFEEKLKWKLLTKYTKAWSNYFKTKEDVIKFLRDTQRWIKSSQMNCTISKIVYSLNEIIDNPELLELDKKAQYFLQKNVIYWVWIDEKDFDTLINFWIVKSVIRVNWKIVEFNIRYRAKNWDSSASKIIKDPLYWKWEDIKDSIWIELEVDTPENVVLILEHFYYKMFSKNTDKWLIENTITEFKNKWIINKDLVEDLRTKWLIEDDFYNVLSNINYSPKSMQNWWYKDAKIVWTVDLPIDISDRDSSEKPHWVEFRCILVWNTNEEWLADHRVLEIWKIILMWIRLRWYITDFFVKYLINDLLDNNPDLDEKFSKDEILNYFISKLEEVPKKWKIKIYTSKKRNLLDFYKNLDK